MIDISGLVHFLAVAQHQSLAGAAEELSLTPSAVSKSLKRLEGQLQTQLFDREGRALKLNADGRRLVERAMPLVASAEQVRTEFAGERHTIKCRIAGPDLLHMGWAQRISDVLAERYPRASLTFAHSSDEATIAAVLSGECEVGIVALENGRSLDARLAAVPLGMTEFRVAVGALHPLAHDRAGRARARARAAIPIAELLKHDFVVPLTPPFSNLKNQSATDGWRDDVFTRNIRYRTDNLLLVQSLLQCGRVAAFLPDFVISAWDLHTVSVSGCPYRCLQQVVMIHRPSIGLGWVTHLAEHMARSAIV